MSRSYRSAYALLRGTHPAHAARRARAPAASTPHAPGHHSPRRTGARLAQPWMPACGRLERPCTRAPVPPARRGACTRAGQPRTPACGRLERPCTRAPVPPARGACTRAGQRTTTHEDEKMLRAHTGAKPETPIDGVRTTLGAAPATGPPPCSSHASVAHTATRPSSQGPASALRFNCQTGHLGGRRRRACGRGVSKVRHMM